MTEKILSHEELLGKVVYHPETGLFTWRQDHQYSKTIKAGDVVSPNARSMGYRVASINKVRFYQHRLAWLYVYGVWPDKPIDHINGDKADNRIENLRLATLSENQQNRKKTKTKPCMTGAYKHWSGKWYSTIMVKKKRHYLGFFESQEEAAAAYARAKSRLHPFSPNLPIR